MAPLSMRERRRVSDGSSTSDTAMPPLTASTTATTSLKPGMMVGYNTFDGAAAANDGDNASSCNLNNSHTSNLDLSSASGLGLDYNQDDTSAMNGTDPLGHASSIALDGRGLVPPPATDDDDGHIDETEHTTFTLDEDFEDLPLWKRVPPALGMAIGLFTVSLLTCLGTVYQYKVATNHSRIYAFIFTSVKGAIIGFSAFVISKTFWYTQQDLERSLEQQDRMLALLSNVYPEHVLQRLLEEDEENQTETNTLLTPPPPIPDATFLNRLQKQHSAANLDDLHEGDENNHDDVNNEDGKKVAARVTVRQDSISTMASLGGISNQNLTLSPKRKPRTRRVPASAAAMMMDQSARSANNPLDASIVSLSHNNHNGVDGSAQAHPLYSNNNNHHAHVTKSVTDLYPNTTVFYSQIVGFTAWSSQRAPNQVFELLETIFCEFDTVATRGNIFKVESIADTYIAVTGLPEADAEHAVRMAQFASDCLASFQATTEKLERSLGPDTGDLQLRIGLHSGPVTAGVLRGERSRFQLFGNTVNNAMITERQGEGNHIHVSRETAELIQNSGKAHWVVPRERSEAGMTYWLAAAKGKQRRPSCSHGGTPPMSPTSASESSDSDNNNNSNDDNDDDDDDSSAEYSEELGPIESDDDMSVLSSDTGITYTSSMSSCSSGSRKKAWTMQDILTAKEQRLIEWTVDQLSSMLKKIVARRNAVQRYEERHGLSNNKSNSATPPILHYTPKGGMVLDEVQESIDLPKYSDALLREDALHDASNVVLGDRVVEELTNFVSTVTTFYYDPGRNPFHNFMHASHVLMSTVKMMQRIISPSQAALGKIKLKKAGEEDSPDRRRSIRRSMSLEELHDHTYGITTDPLTQFAVVFAALIHDLDHPGVPNATLVKEKTRLARVYNNRSISEQNSLDMAWDLLMDPSYQNLVRTICFSQDELKRFRQLLVQTVMATDIADAELRQDRNERWDMAFAKKEITKSEGRSLGKRTPSGRSLGDDSDQENANLGERNRKATIVLEHLLQASDIAHTMQHWEVFKKWNEKLFREMYLAYLHDRSDKDPGEFWYKGEIGFFKFYIIPLAKKLSDCGVFGVSSDEYLNYAQNNLQIWETKGEEVVAEFREAVERDYGTKEERMGKKA